MSDDPSCRIIRVQLYIKRVYIKVIYELLKKHNNKSIKDVKMEIEISDEFNKERRSL